MHRRSLSPSFFATLALCCMMAPATAQTPLQGGVQQNEGNPGGGDIFNSQGAKGTGVTGSCSPFGNVVLAPCPYNPADICQRDTYQLAHETPPPGWGPPEHVSLPVMENAPTGYYARCAVDACNPRDAVCWRNLTYKPPAPGQAGPYSTTPPYLPPVPGGLNVCNDPNAWRIPQCKTNAPHVTTALKTGGTKTLCTSAELAKITFERYGTGLPIRIARAGNPGFVRRTFVVFLAGTEFSSRQTNNGITDVLEALKLASEYDTAVMNAIITAVPPGSDLIFVGHSLGGMVAQNLTARLAQQTYYPSRLRVTRIISFGSPKTTEDVPGVVYTRFIAKGDVIPGTTVPSYLSPAHFTYIDNGINYASLHTPYLDEHLVYPASTDLKSYDAFGVPGGRNCLQLDENQSWTYPAPTN